MTPNAKPNMPVTARTPANPQTNMNVPRDEIILQAQRQLQDQGLYHGRIDGILGPETEQALGEFQKRNGLNRTATLDQPTMDKLFGNQGTSTGPTVSHGTGQMTNPQSASPGTPRQ